MRPGRGLTRSLYGLSVTLGVKCHGCTDAHQIDPRLQLSDCIEYRLLKSVSQNSQRRNVLQLSVKPYVNL